MNKLLSSTSSLQALLQQHFGFSEFLPCQEDAVRAIVEGRDVFVNIATSGGKSLCFQLPALILDGLTVVVSPLIALMHDQVENLKSRGICAAYIDSTLDGSGLAAQWELVKTGQAKLLYCSPEKLMTEGFYEKLGSIKVVRLVVDEAHCVSMWGHDFRREYLDIPTARERLGNPPLAALTATAPVLVRDDIVESLRLQGCEQIFGEMDRRNLVIDVETFWSEYAKWEWLLKKLRAHSKDGKKTLVYCRRIRSVEEIAQELSKLRGISYCTYHGEMDKAERSSVERKFHDGITPILIGTKAFGMGIDIEDIRYVYHYEVPESLESYWQEIGRAGRDGHRCYCTLMFQHRDVHQIQRFVRSSNPKLPFVMSVWRSLCRWVKDWNVEVPERYYNEEKFSRDFGGGDDFLINQVRAAIAQLSEHKVIEIWGSTCRFLLTPKQVEEFGFPITEVELDNKRDAAIQRLKIMMYYATHAGDNPRRVIMGHFLHNSIADEVRDLDVESWYQVPEEVLLAMCTCLARRDCRTADLISHLRGAETVAKRDRDESFGALKQYNAFEVRMDVAQAGVLGYVRPFKLDDRTFMTLTPQGMAFLKQRGVKVEPAESYSELKRSMHSPVNKPLLEEALSSWRILNRGRRTADDWWRRVEEFLEDRFEVLGETQDGFQLAADFVHKKAILKKSKKRSETSGKKGAGVRLTDAKLLLNYLFDNMIET